MEEENNQDGAQQQEQTEPEKKESLNDILKETVPEQPKETGEKTELDTQENKQPKESEVKTDTETTKSESLLPRDNFTAEEKEYFKSLDDAGKKVMLDKWGNLESGYDKKFKAVASERKILDGFKQLYEPYENDLKMMGTTPMQYTQNLLNLDIAARKDPAKFVKWFAQNYNVDLATLNQTPEEQDPTTQELNSLRGEIGTLKQEISQKELTGLAKQIENFKNTVDAEGNLKYPHFDAVREDMAKLNTATGEADLVNLYNKAVRLNDDLYQKQLEAEFAKKQSEVQKQADLAKAKKAGRPVKSSFNAKVSKNDKVSLSQIIREEIS